MTLQDIQRAIVNCASVEDCDAYLKSVLAEVRPLFYGRTRAELCANHAHLSYEDAILSIAASPVGCALTRSRICPDSILALLIFFMSLFGRVRLYGAIFTVASLLPSGSLHDRAEAVFQYKNISDASTDFEQRFDKIVCLLQSSYDSGDEKSRQQCLDLLIEYFLDAVLESQIAGIDIYNRMRALFENKASQIRFSILSNSQVQEAIACTPVNQNQLRSAVRSRIIESLHAEACRLVPDVLLPSPLEESTGVGFASAQAHRDIPSFLNTQLQAMGARYEQQRGNARTNFDATHERNRIYLGTFFPRTVIESWNIFHELLSMPVVGAAFSQKEAIRILDIGSGTGGAVIGFLLALRSWGRCAVPVEITSIDVNEDALNKQRIILEAIAPSLPFGISFELRRTSLPFDLESFVPSFASIAASSGPRYDVVTSWKCLCEFYNVNFAQAQGIVHHTLNLASKMLVPYGLFVAADVTSADNNYEFFSFTLNREANEHDSRQDAVARTILPVPCAKNMSCCLVKNCFTQRRFNVNHQLISGDSTKIAYRVLAPVDFARSIVSGFRSKPAYRVNAARPLEACREGNISVIEGSLPCGYTGFF